MTQTKWFRLVLVVGLLAVMFSSYGGVCDKEKSKSDSSGGTTSGSSAPAGPTILAPSNLTATVILNHPTYGNIVNFTWQDNSDNENGFRLYFQPSGAGWFYVPEVIAPNRTDGLMSMSYFYTNYPTANNTYSFEIAAYTGDYVYFSPTSNTVVVILP